MNIEHKPKNSTTYTKIDMILVSPFLLNIIFYSSFEYWIWYHNILLAFVAYFPLCEPHPSLISFSSILQCWILKMPHNNQICGPHESFFDLCPSERIGCAIDGFVLCFFLPFETKCPKFNREIFLVSIHFRNQSNSSDMHSMRVPKSFRKNKLLISILLYANRKIHMWRSDSPKPYVNRPTWMDVSMLILFSCIIHSNTSQNTKLFYNLQLRLMMATMISVVSETKIKVNLPQITCKKPVSSVVPNDLLIWHSNMWFKSFEFIIVFANQTLDTYLIDCAHFIKY